MCVPSQGSEMSLSDERPKRSHVFPRLAPDLLSRVFQTLDLIGQLRLGLLQLVLEFLKFYVSCRYKTFYRL